MQTNYFTEETIANVLKDIKPYFKERLGRNTHKKRSEDWCFYGLAFTREDVVYVFGINMGFFRKEGQEKYNKVGMNVLVRTNGEKMEERLKYRDFFRDNLKGWINQNEDFYSSERGGEGVEFARYKELAEFNNEDEIVNFLKNCIDGLRRIYPKIVENTGHIFDKVVRAAPHWEEKIIDFCKKHEKI